MSTMVFIDGTNLLTEMGKRCSLEFRPDLPPDEILICAAEIVRRIFQDDRVHPLRYYWFGSYKGSDKDRDRIADALRQRHMDATLFERRNNKEKGVDIGLTKEMLVQAFHRNCARSVLVAGDEDYVSLVNEVKRYGQKVEGAFFTNGFSPHLHRVLDGVHDLDPIAATLGETLTNCQRDFPLKPSAALVPCPQCGNPMKKDKILPS